MQVTKTVKETRDLIKNWKREGKTIGLVPTMGFLHEGHASLIKRCREENDIVVVSDFVNPTQFGPTEDLEAYPRDFKRDSELCESLGADVIFHPEPEDMYHDPHAFVSIDTLSDTLCGKTRPIHFKGVCTVVSKLFNIVTPDRAYFGQKDAQQLAIIRKMVQDLNFDIQIIGCPIIREEDGLAKSSRNTYLSEEERKAALSFLLSSLKNKAIDKRADLTEEEEGQVILKEIKQLKETIDMTPEDRTDLIEEAQKRLAVLEEYSPKFMSEYYIKAVITSVLADLGIDAPTAKDKGKIMKELMPKVKGKADGKEVNQILAGMMK